MGECANASHADSLMRALHYFVRTRAATMKDVKRMKESGRLT